MIVVCIIQNRVYGNCRKSAKNDTVCKNMQAVFCMLMHYETSPLQVSQ